MITSAMTPDSSHSTLSQPKLPTSTGPFGSYVPRNVPPRGDLALDQRQRERDRPLGEQAASGAEQDRVDHQVPAVDQPGTEQRLDQVAAPVHLELGTIGLLKGGDRLDHVTL